MSENISTKSSYKIERETQSGVLPEHHKDHTQKLKEETRKKVEKRTEGGRL